MGTSTQILTRRRMLAAKIEVVEGTEEALTVAEGGILVSEPKWSADVKELKRDIALPTLSKIQDVMGMKLAKISFKTELMGSTKPFSATNLPPVDPYLRACGFAATLDVTPGSETVTYMPASQGIPSLTIGLYTDGVLKKITGARGTVKFSADNGGQVFAEFEFTGNWNDLEMKPTLLPDLPMQLPPLCSDAQFKIDDYAPVLKSFSIDMGNKIEPREDMNSPTGYRGIRFTDRDPRGQFDPELEDFAKHDFYKRWIAGTAGELSIGALGTDQYNKLSITAPKLVYTKVAEGDRGGIELASTDFQLATGTAGDDEIAIQFS